MKRYADMTAEEKQKHRDVVYARRMQLKAENRCPLCKQVRPDKRAEKIEKLRAQIAALEAEVKP